MKLILENWRKFLTEEEVLVEKCWDGYKQVGLKKKGDRMVPNCVPIGENINEAEGDYFPWLQQLRDDSAKFIEDQQDKGGRVGSGSFRTVVVPEEDKDFVVKILRYGNNDSYMNKVEKLLGDEFPGVFPRVFAHDPDYRWIVMERVQPISTRNDEMLEEALVATMPKLHQFAYDLLSLEDGSPSSDTKPFNMLRYIVMAAAPRLRPIDLPYGDNTRVTDRVAKIQEFGLANEPWFTQLSKAMKRYGVQWSDLAEGNVGVDMKDHTLKVIDASVFSPQSGEKDWNDDISEEMLTEKCWAGYEKKGMKKMFGKMYPNCVKKKKSKKKNEEVEIDEAGRSDRYDPRNYVGRDQGRRFTHGSDGKRPPDGLYGEEQEITEADPKKGTGKKPQGSGRRLYTDEDPSDTVSVKFSTVQDIKDTLSKASFKSKSHKRQSQIINLIHQRARAAYKNAKDPKVKARLKKSYEYAKKRKEASKRKTQQMNKKK
jgi:hypothetical protein